MCVIVTIAPVIATIVHVIVRIAHVIVTIASVIVTIAHVIVRLVIDKDMNFKESEIKFEPEVFFENLKMEILSKSKVCPSDFIQKQFEGKSLRTYNIDIMNFLKDASSLL